MFVAYVRGKGVKVIDFETKKQAPLVMDASRNGKVAQIKATPDARFVFIGVPSTSSVGVFSLDSGSLALTIQKWIRVDFRTFEMDDQCSCIVFMNDKCRILELYGVRWEFDKAQLDLDAYSKLNDAFIDQDEEQYNSQFKARNNKSGRSSIAQSQALLEGGKAKTACCSIF